MNLLDLKPKRSSFKIDVKGRKHKLCLRPFSLRDQAWIQENYGDEDLLAKILAHDVQTIANLIWQMLEPRSKKKIMEFDINFIDVDEVTGEEKEIHLNGKEKLLELLDEASIQRGLQAFAETRGLNNAVANKSIKEIKKKMKQPIGEKSLI